MTEAQPFAVVEEGRVINIIAAQADFVPPVGMLVADPNREAQIGGTWNGATFGPFVPTKTRQEMAADIIALCDAIYAKPMLYAEEYKAREAEASAYRAAGYSGAAPRVQAFADAEGLTLAQAVDVTLAQASAMRSALPVVSDMRMRKRYVVREDITDAQATASYNDAMQTLRAIQAQIA